MTTTDTPTTTAGRAGVRRGWIAAYAIASTGMWLAFLTPAQVQLARQAEIIDPAGKEALLGLVTGLGAAVTMIAVPLFGALSDRTRTPFGRRRPWILGGAVLAAAGLAVLGLTAPGVGVLLGGWALAQVGLAGLQAGLVATIPDEVPPAQLGAVTGWAGMTQMFGALLGTVLVNGVVTELGAGYLVCALVMLAAVVPFLVRHREGRAAPPAPAVAGERPRVSADLVWTWSGRFLVTLAFALVTQYLLYYVTDELQVPDPQRAVLTVTAVTVLCAMVAALVTGRWSDRIGRRKVFVAAGGALMALGGLQLAVLPVWPLALTAGAAIGLGFGTFLAVDLAVVATVLPSAANTGRDLGVFAVANTAPQVLAPALAVPVLALGGYPALYVVVALAAGVGGALVFRVRAVR